MSEIKMLTPEKIITTIKNKKTGARRVIWYKLQNTGNFYRAIKQVLPTVCY